MEDILEEILSLFNNIDKEKVDIHEDEIVNISIEKTIPVPLSDSSLKVTFDVDLYQERYTTVSIITVIYLYL